MPGSNFPSTYVKQFNANVIQLAQQQTQRLAHIITKEGNVVGDTVFFPRLDPSEMRERTTKNTNTVYQDLRYTRRGTGFRTYDWAVLDDKIDIRRIAKDPTSAETQNAAWAKVRKMDDVAYAAMTGVSYETSGNSTVLSSVAFPTDNIIASDAVLSGTNTNASYELLKLGVKRIEEQDVDLDNPMNQLFVVLNASAVEALKDDDKVINRDTNREGNTIVASGRLTTPIAGAIPLTYNRLTIDGSNDAFGVMFARSGMGFMRRGNQGIRIKEESTFNYATSIFMEEEFASLRLQDTHVVIIKFRQA